MLKRNHWARVLVFATLASVAAACGDDGDDRAALEQEELERELELALEEDTEPTSFEDAPEETAPEPPPARTQPQRQPQQTRREPQRTQSPPPTRETPRERPAPRPEPAVRTIPTGTTFAVELDQEISTENSQPGDGFSATLRDPIVGADGTVLVPSGAKVRGRVTALDTSDRVGETAVIKLAFETVSFNGRSYPLKATVVEANPERRSRASAGEQAGKIAAGAAAGAVLGQVLGKNTSSTLKGAAIGAAAGTAIAMGTADVDAVLPSGSRMVIRLDGPVEVPVS